MSSSNKSLRERSGANPGIAEIAVLGFAFDGLLRLLLRLADPTVRR